MIQLTPLLSQYKDSFFLYTFRHIDRMRLLHSKQLVDILATELTYLYNIACIITYKEVQNDEIDQVKLWALTLDSKHDLEHFKILFNEKMIELNLRAFVPQSYSYSFKTIWDVIHFLALIIDDMVANRNGIPHERLIAHMRQLKAIYYNLFFKLDCAMCRDHYLNVKGYLILNIERNEIALNRERYGQPIEYVDVAPFEIDSDTTNKNLLMRYGTLYASMVFHNHINEYRWVQRNMKPPANAFKMNWTEYKKMLNLQ